jgi:Cu-Zn family superoxide dismutase
MKHLLSSHPRTALSVFCMAVAMTGCATTSTGPSASATIAPTSVAASAGMNPQGQVRFVQQGDGVRVTGRITGLRPGQEHGFHVHEAADCSGDGLGTKGHFNPLGVAHGQHGSAMHHAGDLPSLKANAAGVAEFDVVVKQLSVAAGPTSVVGRGLIVHRDRDDFATQPTGNAGPRPGCAVIQAE